MGDITPLCPLIWNEPRLRAAIFSRRTHREAAGCCVCRVRASLCTHNSIRSTGAVRFQHTDLYADLYALNPAHVSEGFHDTGTHCFTHPHPSDQPGNHPGRRQGFRVLRHLPGVPQVLLLLGRWRLRRFARHHQEGALHCLPGRKHGVVQPVLRLPAKRQRLRHLRLLRHQPRPGHHGGRRRDDCRPRRARCGRHVRHGPQPYFNRARVVPACARR